MTLQDLLYWAKTNRRYQLDVIQHHDGTCEVRSHETGASIKRTLLIQALQEAYWLLSETKLNTNWA